MGGNGARSRTAAAGGVAGAAGAGGWAVAGAGGGFGLGPGLKQAPYVKKQTADDHDPNWAHMSQQENRQLQQRMGQTGNEAGITKGQGATFRSTLYVGTSKSYNINAYLRTQGQDATSPLSGWIYKDSHGNYHGNLSINDIRNTIRQMDNGMKPLPKAINATRVEGSDMTLSTFGLNNYTKNDIMKMDSAQLNSLFTGKVRYNDGYTSMAYNERGIKMDGRCDVCVEYTIKQGTKVIQTNNLAEHETIVDRGYAQKCTSARIGNAFGKKMLIINVTVIPQDQSHWWKV